MHPVAFQFGQFTIHWYGILFAIGFLTGIWTASRRAMIDRIRPETIMDLVPWLIGGAIIGARFLYVIEYWDNEFAGKSFIDIFKIWQGGLVFYGGLLGATIGGYYYVRRNNLPLWKVADAVAPSIALGHFFGRLGCLMTGCCYGRACELPWAIQFPQDHITHPNRVHPTQIYESLLNLALYLGLAWLFRHRKFDGQVFAVYLVSYAFLRVFVEIFRGDYAVRYLGGILTPGQLVSALILVGGIALLMKLPRPNHGTT